MYLIHQTITIVNTITISLSPNINTEEMYLHVYSACLQMST